MSALKSLITALVLMSPLVAGASDAVNVQVTGAWARATPPGMTMGVVYLSLKSQQDDQGIGASTGIAASVEMHESLMSNGVMSMRALTSVPLQRGQSVIFEPSGKHFMLIGLRKPLESGATFPFTLKFAKAGTLTVNVSVRKDE